MKYLPLLAFLLLPMAAAADPVQVTAEAVPLDEGEPANLRLGPLAFVDGLVLTGDDARFGGWSDLLIEGNRILLLGDEGSLLSARLVFDAEGRLAGLADADLVPLLDEAGKPFADKRLRDAESMARLPDGSLVVGFERRHRLLRYARPGGPAAPFLSPPELQEAGDPNQGLEALTTWPDGRLIGLLEGSQDHDATLALVWQDQGVVRLIYPLEDGFQVTEADVLPHPEGGGGDLLVLERFYTPETGPKARLRLVPGESFAPETLAPGQRLAPQLWGELAWPRTVDNMEGLAAVRDGQGRTFVYLLSDDNFNRPAQRTLLLRFELAYE